MFEFVTCGVRDPCSTTVFTGAYYGRKPNLASGQYRNQTTPMRLAFGIGPKCLLSVLKSGLSPYTVKFRLPSSVSVGSATRLIISRVGRSGRCITTIHPICGVPMNLGNAVAKT